MRAHSEITWGTEGHWSRKHCPSHQLIVPDCGPPTLIMSKNYMSRNDELRQGDSLTSNNGEWKAVFQEDTNFVIYGTKPVWASDTYGLDGIRLCLQDDCNLVMYNQRHQILWSTNSQ
uniref:Bulb-type lectin domain-containing protein n=1 Tax=Gasterosteus aculeatus aculeatus TaxID=481459 RepID=A0AAQ4P1A3_GASAC